MKYIYLFFLLFIYAGTTIAQNTAINFFRADVTQQNHVYLCWELKSGYTCNGINIYHSTDNNNFSLIGDIQGICGSVGNAERYYFTHHTPQLNSINYYMIELGANGDRYFSQTVVYALNEQGYTIFPNPSNGVFNFYFNNVLNEIITVTLFDLQGKMIASQTTTTNSLILDLMSLESGFYFYTISAINISANGKLIKL
jgi:hypothetical protein